MEDVYCPSRGGSAFSWGVNSAPRHAMAAAEGGASPAPLYPGHLNAARAGSRLAGDALKDHFLTTLVINSDTRARARVLTRWLIYLLHAAFAVNEQE